jgi:fatty acid desaturase
MSRLFRQAGGAWPNLLTVAYTFAGWAAGVWMLTLPWISLNAAGVLLTAHALIISAYLIHECVHQTIFAAPVANDRLGALCGWLNGACLANYAGLKKKHLRHHADRLDVVTFDYRAALNATPRWVRKTVLALEWAYIPVIELMMRGMVIAAPFYFGTVRDRARLLSLLIIRVAFFVALAFVSIKALLLYALAYILFLHVLRFMDAYQHTYDVFPSRSLEPAPADPRRTRRYEYENTYSNLVAVRWPWLNLLTLNFAYHNAHHARSGEPWYRLPALHHALYGENDPQVLPCRDLIAGYHRNRVTRVFAADYGSVGTDTTGSRASQFIGAVGVSFLTAI